MRLVEDTTDPIEWLRTFETQHSRRLRVLHIGNIANNAYLNAKFLRSVGVEAHVVSYDYQHVMATPEWEEIELLHSHGDDFLPRFSKRDLRGYRRPSWFVSGPLPACASEIATLWGERPSRWRRSALYLLKRLVAVTTKLFGVVAGHAVHLLIIEPRLFIYKLWGYLRSRLGAQNRALDFLCRHGHRLKRALSGIPFCARHTSRLPRLINLIDRYDKAFPQRPDRLKVADIVPYQFLAHHFRDMFRHYDIVQCYATEPIRALLSGKRPYVAFEHGTLRDFTMGDVPLHRLTALAYREADHTFITNGDCLAYAKRLGIESYRPITHPVDVAQHRQNFGDAIAKLRQEIDGDVILFCPVRHDWEVKGIAV